MFDRYIPELHLLRPNLRRAKRLQRKGTPATARIVGISVEERSDSSPDRHEWALEVDGRRYGVRQRIVAELSDHVRLGQVIDVLIDDDGGALIDIEVHESTTFDHKVVDPPPDGITDTRNDLTKERKKAPEATFVVQRAERFALMGMPTRNVTIDVTVQPAEGASYETTLKRVEVPFYARHLLDPGTRLPGTARSGKERIDWPAAAMADPGVGRPPSAIE